MYISSGGLVVVSMYTGFINSWGVLLILAKEQNNDKDNIILNKRILLVGNL